MIYHFTWNSHYLVTQQVRAWKDKFIEKYWDFNLVDIKNLGDVDKNFLVENITAMSFFQDKKLIIVECEIWSKDTKISQNIDYIIEISKNLPQENILLIYSISPDKRSKQYKSINSIAELKEFSSWNENESFHILKNKFSEIITDWALHLLIRYKSNNLEKITSEIQKLSILFDKIDEKVIKDNIYPELEENIFQLIDDILNKNFIQARQKLLFILSDTNIYALYNGIIANLRTNIFISELKKQRKNPTEIAQILNLGNKKFLINKQIALQHIELKWLYIDLVSLDKKMKSWKLIGTEEKDFQLEFENTLLKYLT